MKKAVLASLAAFLLFCMPCHAKTNIFGDSPGNHVFSTTVGADSAVVSYGYTPVEAFSWLIRGVGALTDNGDRKGAKWDTTMIGVGIEFPVVNLNSLFEEVPVNAVGFMAISLDFDIENDQRAFVPIDVGFDVHFNEHIDLRVVKPVKEINGNQYDAYTPDWRIGVAVRW